MIITVDVPDYNSSTGFIYKWEDDFSISVKIENQAILIKANKDGLLSLANHLLNLAQDVIPISYHLHLDDYNSLENGSSELIIMKI